MSAKTIACRILDTMGASYTLHEYDVDEEALDAVTVADKVGLPPDRVFKTLVVRGDKTGVMLACIPGDREVDFKALATLSGDKRVELVSLKEVQPLTGYVRGGVSPLGTKKRYPVYADSTLAALDPVSVSAGRRGLQIFLRGQDLVAACQGRLGPISR